MKHVSNETTITPTTKSNMRDIRASLAVIAADLAGPENRLAAVKGLCRTEDDDEARSLIARGRRLARKREGVGS
jgi:hypothetical protein